VTFSPSIREMSPFFPPPKVFLLPLYVEKCPAFRSNKASALFLGLFRSFLASGGIPPRTGDAFPGWGFRLALRSFLVSKQTTVPFTSSASSGPYIRVPGNFFFLGQWLVLYFDCLVFSMLCESFFFIELPQRLPSPLEGYIPIPFFPPDMGGPQLNKCCVQC